MTLLADFFEQGLEFSDAFGVVGGDVVFLGEIIFEVVEFDRFIFIGGVVVAFQPLGVATAFAIDEEPVAVAYGVWLVGVVDMCGAHRFDLALE